MSKSESTDAQREDLKDFKNEYWQYLQEAEKKMLTWAKLQKVHSIHEGKSKLESFRNKPLAYKIQSGLAALAQRFESNKNICVAVGYDKTSSEELLIADNTNQPKAEQRDFFQDLISFFTGPLPGESPEENQTKIAEIKEEIKNLLKENCPDSAAKLFQTLETRMSGENASAKAAQARLKKLSMGENSLKKVITLLYVPGINNMIVENKGTPKKTLIAPAQSDGHIHAEVKILASQKSLENFYLGISKTCCPKCTGYMSSVYEANPDLKDSNAILYRQGHDNALQNWILPSGAEHLKRAIGDSLYDTYVTKKGYSEDTMREWVKQIYTTNEKDKESDQYAIWLQGKRRISDQYSLITTGTRR